MSRSEPNAPSSARSARRLDRWTQSLRGAIFDLPAWPFFLGVALSFMACSLAGRAVSGRPMLENFVRFFSPIQPQRYFYPTASQLVAHVRHTVPKDKTLVLVGGASYFRGTGQNPGELWSLELQRQLGPHHAVVNFAIDQAEITSFAAVAFAILSREYPKIVYVSNAQAMATAPQDGGDDYRFVFWDAYYKGLLPSSVASAPPVRELRDRQLRDAATLELHLGKWLDQFAYACDLWTYLGYKNFFTVWADEHRYSPFAPRRREREADIPNLAGTQADIRRDTAYINHSENFARRASRRGFLQTASGPWDAASFAWSRFEANLRTQFPSELRPKIFAVLLRGNPYFMQTLTPEERERSERIYRLSQQAYERAGYQVVQLRPQDFTADDFLDGGHLMASGGAKVARAVAAQIEAVARRAERVAATPSGQLAGPVEITFTLPADRTPRSEILLTAVSANSTERLSLDYLDPEKIRFTYTHGEPAVALHSPPFTSPAGATHTMLASLSGLYPRTAEGTKGRLTSTELHGLKNWLLLQLDGHAFWEAPLDGGDKLPAEVFVGQPPPTPPAGAPAAFTGRIIASARPFAPPTRLHRDQITGARLRLTLGGVMANRTFPLVTTGKPGAGDVLFLRVDDRGRVVFGYDHWGTAPFLSPEVPLGFGTGHTLEIRLPALASPGAPAELSVHLDGQLIWRPTVPHYQAAPEHIYFGKNPIGATCSEPILINATFEAILTPAWRGN